MTWASDIGVRPSVDGADAFGRFRSAGTGQRLDVEFLNDKQPDYFDETTNNGTVTHNANTGDLTLSLSDAANGSYAYMSSFPVPYTPGNSQLIEITGALDLAALGGGNCEVFLRSSISGSPADLDVVAQSSWTSRTSGVDWTKSHIFGMDFQSLKVGTIRFFMVAEGVITYVSQINNDNLRNSGYWQRPDLPVYYKLYTTGGNTYMELGYGDDDNAIGFRYKVTANASATMKAICCTVKSEGGLDLQNMAGLPRSADMVATARTVSTTLLPVISIRSRATFNSIRNQFLTLVKSFSVQTNEAILVRPVVGATLTGSPSWADVSTSDSTMEYDVAASGITGGRVLESEYIYAVSTGPQSAQFQESKAGVLGKEPLWDRTLSDAETGIFSLVMRRTGASDASVLASINWEELR